MEQLYRELYSERQPFRLYNPVGNLVDYTAPETNFEKYVLRMSDLEGGRRAALLTVALRQAGATDESAARLVNASSLREPYKGQAFEWSAKERAVVFLGAELGERGRYVFAL